MDQRGQHWSDSSRYPHRTTDSRFAQQEWDVSFLPPDPRDRGPHWAHPDPRYLSPFTSPPARPEWVHYNSQQYVYGYGWQEHQRSPSRLSSDYPPHNRWDYRGSSHYRGQHAQQGTDGGQWSLADSGRAGKYHERSHRQEGAGSLQTEEYRYNPVQDSSQQYFSDFEDRPSKDSEDIFSSHPGTLERFRTSGLSSSSYELSQYMNGADQCEPDTQPAVTSGGEREAVHHISAPLKFTVPHAVVSFGPAGQLIRIAPHFSAQDNVSQLEIHSMETSVCGLTPITLCSTRPQTSPPFMPATAIYAPPVSTVATNQNFSCHSTDNVEVTSQLHFPPSNLSAAEEAELFSGAEQVLEVNITRQQQQVVPPAVEGSEGAGVTPKETKTGWFRGWFKSKPENKSDAQEEKSEQEGPTQTDPPPIAGLYPPSLPTAPHPGTFPSPPYAAGINPFSRKAVLSVPSPWHDIISL
ncbi:protein transport protein Sec16B-like [Nematolebias whitei]|uniref:protein transport protein Sec16B-like n=1 Tax=Nematolebias whitei TaxID=451745 RepID=UPI00189722F4|nr:protein transport protein Sec16B-like [Nematolebias whitei]